MNAGEIKSPFKFLDPYNKSDRDFFFGRDKEVKLLYDFVNKNRIVLVYGQSGTGKTSIIQCGLANEFDVTDWNPFFIRRGDNLNQSLAKSLEYTDEPATKEALENLINILFTEGIESKEEQEEPGSIYQYDEKVFIAGLVYNLHKITEHYLRQVYIIFDQFEELLILAEENERSLFIKTLKILLGPYSIVDCHIIIVMREEYFAWLDNFEKDIPGISDRRLRIETMRTKEITTVIIDSCRQFNITLPEPEKNAAQMVKALAKQGDVALPYLQVYLDQLWRKDYEETFPEGYKGSEKLVPLTFTTEEITRFGEIKDVMQRFLMEQRNIVQHEIKNLYPATPENFLKELLDCFVNEQGTKKPNAYFVEKELYKFNRYAPRLLKDTDPELMKFTLDLLERCQILRNDGNSFELGHDILAKLINKQRDAKQQRLNGIKVMIGIQRKSNELIPFDLVKNWDRYISQLDLSEYERKFFDESKLVGEKIENDRLFKEKVKSELDKREAEYLVEAANKKTHRNKVLLVIALLLISVLGFTYWKVLNTMDSYYALDIVARMDKESNKEDILMLDKYVYDFKNYDEDKKNIIIENIMKIVSAPLFAKKIAKANFTLLSAITLTAGLDVSISDNGKFIAVRNDSANVSKSGSFLIADINNNRVIETFKNVKYAYFLNASDTLVLAISDSSSILDSYYPDRFVLYNCHNRHTEIFQLNNAGSSLSMLYNKEFLDQNTFSEWDSYKVRIMPSGKLLVPYFKFENQNSLSENRPLKKIYIGDDKKQEVFNTNSEYSISTSKNAGKVLYCYKKDGRLYFDIFTNEGILNLVQDAEYADFLANGSLVYTKGNALFICAGDGTILKTLTLEKNIASVVNGSNDNYLMAINGDLTLSLINFNDTPGTMQFKETLIGCNFQNKTFITYNTEADTSGLGNKLILRDFTGEQRKQVNVSQGIESVLYNDKSNSFLLKTKKLPNSNLQLLYLYDDVLGLKGSFFLTPNDSYGFSNDGKTFFYVRDNELSVFNNQQFVDLSNFDSINAWLTAQKMNNGDAYNSKIRELLKKYKLKRFPTQIVPL